MSQGWILPDGSMSSNEMEYNTPWLFEDPISDDLPQAAGTISAFVDPRVAAVSKTGALTDYINAGTGGGSSSSGAHTPWVPGESVEWSGGLGLPSWAANGLAQAGKFGLGMMGAPSLITGPLGAMASAALGDENSTAESVRNKVGNSIIGAGLSAINPIAGIVNTVLGAFGFDAMRGLTNLNAADPLDGGTKAGFWNDAKPGPSYYNPSSPYGSWMDNSYCNPSSYSYGSWTGPSYYNPFSSYGSWTDPSYYNLPSSYGSWMDNSYYNPSSSYGSSSDSGSSSSSGWNGNSYSDSYSFTGGGSGGSYSDSGSQSDSDSSSGGGW